MDVDSCHKVRRLGFLNLTLLGQVRILHSLEHFKIVDGSVLVTAVNLLELHVESVGVDGARLGTVELLLVDFICASHGRDSHVDHQLGLLKAGEASDEVSRKC